MLPILASYPELICRKQLNRVVVPYSFWIVFKNKSFGEN